MDSEPNPPGYIEIICGTLGLITLMPPILWMILKNGPTILTRWGHTHIPNLLLFVLPTIFFSISHIFRKRRTQSPKH